MGNYRGKYNKPNKNKYNKHKRKNKIEKNNKNNNKKKIKKNNNKKNNWMESVNTIIITLITASTAYVAYLSYKEENIANKNSNLIEKPVINLSVDYLDEQSTYIDKITVNIDDKTVEQLEIRVEPFLNVIFYLPNEKCLVKEVLPIYDLEQANLQFMPYTINFFNTTHGKLAEVLLNDNSYSIINTFYNLCSSQKYINSYNKILPEIFGDHILTSISLEMYIIVDYSDKLKNQYKDVYLCTTGYCGFTGNVTDSCFETNPSISKEIIQYNIEHSVIYAKLKTYIKNCEYHSCLEKIQQNDIVFETYNKFCSDSVHKTNIINYVVTINEQLEKLISDAYVRKQLLFSLTLNEPYWSVCE